MATCKCKCATLGIASDPTGFTLAFYCLASCFFSILIQMVKANQSLTLMHILAMTTTMVMVHSCDHWKILQQIIILASDVAPWSLKSSAKIRTRLLTEYLHVQVVKSFNALKNLSKTNTIRYNLINWLRWIDVDHRH